MSRSRIVAVLWFFGGAAFILAGALSDRRGVTLYMLGGLFFVIGFATLRGRRGAAPPPAPKQ